MGTIERAHRYWQNTKSMPFLLRMLSQGAMIAAPLLLLLLVLPITEWDINGRTMSYAELWSSGAGPLIAITLVLVAAGTWGLAARSRASRWVLVFSPLVPYFILAVIPASPSESIMTDGVVSVVATSAVLYYCLFRLESVREYIDSKN